MKKILLITCFLFIALAGSPCLILFLTDGKNRMVANHEDWMADDAEVAFIPGTAKKFGMVWFGFASEGTPQGGMNTEGLFFDGTATPYAPFADNEKKQDCHCNIWIKLLEECANVDQAVALVQQYKIGEIESIHLLFADKWGNSAIVGVYDNKLQIHKRNGAYQLLTNFNITNPSYGDEPPCRRFQTAERLLHEDSSVTAFNLEKILSQTHQEGLTAYSNIYNLTTGEITVYSHANFKKKIRFRLSTELAHGKHVWRLARFLKY